MRVGVITFPGSLDERDAKRAVRLAGGTPVALWHGAHDLEGVEAIILPGGFSYGDYLRAGSIASHAPIMAEVIDAAHKGMPVLGICNGFQMLAEARLVPGAHGRNDCGTFVRRDQKLIVANNTTAWTRDFAKDAEIIIPLKNADGRFVADADTIKSIEDNDQVTFRYVGMNPNGSLDDIAGVSNKAGNVVGLMPHPEHAVEPGFGPDTDAAMRSGLDGLKFFTSVIQNSLLAKA
jgi:phosphoribosylformylglycinamidine synthase I